MLLSGAGTNLHWPSTSDLIAIVAIVFAAIGVYIVYRQLKAGRNTARAQFLLDMDQAFEADNDIRVRLAQREGPPLTRSQWRQVKRYMGHFERVFVFVSQGLLDPKVVHRLYAARFKNIVSNDEIRQRLLKGEKAAHWVDFIKLWQKLDEIEMKASGSHLYANYDPHTTDKVVATEEFEDEGEAKDTEEGSS